MTWVVPFPSMSPMAGLDVVLAPRLVPHTTLH